MLEVNSSHLCTADTLHALKLSAPSWRTQASQAFWEPWKTQGAVLPLLCAVLVSKRITYDKWSIKWYGSPITMKFGVAFASPTPGRAKFPHLQRYGIFKRRCCGSKGGRTGLLHVLDLCLCFPWWLTAIITTSISSCGIDYNWFRRDNLVTEQLTPLCYSRWPTMLLCAWNMWWVWHWIVQYRIGDLAGLERSEMPPGAGPSS